MICLMVSFISEGEQYSEEEKIVHFCRSTDDVIFKAANQNPDAHSTQNFLFCVKYKTTV